MPFLASCNTALRRFGAAALVLLGSCAEPFEQKPDRVTLLTPAPFSATRPFCDGVRWRPARGFVPKANWDSIWTRARLLGPQGLRLLTDSVGTPCGTARDQAECLERVEALEGEAAGRAGNLIIATLGDDVLAFGAGEELQFFGLIDSPDEALWLIAVQHSPCDAQPKVEAERDQETYRVTLHKPAECEYGPVDAGFVEQVHIVQRDGSVAVLPEGRRFGCGAPLRRPSP